MPILLTEPAPFAEALSRRAVQRVLPTTLRTRLLSRIQPALLERSLLSAGVTDVEFLQEAGGLIDELLGGQVNVTEQRLRLREYLARAGYRPEPGKEGTVQDLRSTRRLDLILRTNADMARGYGQWTQGQDPDVLDEFPAQELIRQRRAEVPRQWRDRWTRAGGRLFSGRMIALKNDPIWTAISRFGLPYPPFDFGSGMGVQDVDRDEAEELGLIRPTDTVEPQERGFDEDLQASPAVRDARLRTALEESLGGRYRFDAAGVLTRAGGGAA